MVALTNFIQKINSKLVGLENLDKQYQLAHHLMHLRDIALVVFHGSVIGSAIGGSQELILLEEIIKAIIDKASNIDVTLFQSQSIQALSILVASKRNQNKSSVLGAVISKYPNNLDEKSLKILTEEFKADKEFIQEDYKKCVYAGVIAEFFQKSTASEDILRKTI